MVASGQPETIEDLVRSAFERARASGKEEWTVMTTAVLKNRLLQMTDGSFREGDYGADSLASLLANLPDLVQVTPAPVGPPTVRLLSASPAVDAASPDTDAVTPARTSTPPPGRVRPDLWRGIMDYASGCSYVLDPESRRARPARADDIEGMIRLPTVSAEEVVEWRRDFIATLELGERADLEFWVESRGRTVDLPPKMRGKWNQYLRETVLKRLGDWFASIGEVLPRDIVVASASARGQHSVDDVETLRRFLIDRVRSMTGDELRAISLPVSVILPWAARE